MQRWSSRPLQKAALKRASKSSACRRCLHASSVRAAVTKFSMPAMSPTMSEGGIAQWKMKEGQSFSAGDVLLEVETDKATIDVEAQDDGVLGKIIVPDGSKGIPVGQTIALLAEEGDDVSNLEVPKDEPPNASTSEPSSGGEKNAEHSQQIPPQPSTSQPAKHDVHISSSRPLFPSVQRLLTENGIENADKIKGTGVRGMLTKGDVLAHLGKIPSPAGSYKAPKSIFPESKSIIKEVQKLLDGPVIRQTIVSNFLQASSRSRALPPPIVPHDFDSIISDYLPRTRNTSNPVPVASPPPSRARNSFLDGLI